MVLFFPLDLNTLVLCFSGPTQALQVGGRKLDCGTQDQVPDETLCINFSDSDILRTWMGKAGKSNN